MALNHHYIEDPLKVIETEDVVFEFTESMKAITLRPEPAADYFHIIMPMNLD
jgi:DNA polymerase-3 subunit beta